jgi:hypothetical protein
MENASVIEQYQTIGRNEEGSAIYTEPLSDGQSANSLFRLLKPDAAETGGFAVVQKPH